MLTDSPLIFITQIQKFLSRWKKYVTYFNMTISNANLNEELIVWGGFKLTDQYMWDLASHRIPASLKFHQRNGDCLEFKEDYRSNETNEAALFEDALKIQNMAKDNIELISRTFGINRRVFFNQNTIHMEKASGYNIDSFTGERIPQPYNPIIDNPVAIAGPAIDSILGTPDYYKSPVIDDRDDQLLENIRRLADQLAIPLEDNAELI